ncbi:MAG: hypothetical protein ACTSO7_11880 [Candidatus Heimdallarchaeota archaeon]
MSKENNDISWEDSDRVIEECSSVDHFEILIKLLSTYNDENIQLGAIYKIMEIMDEFDVNPYKHLVDIVLSLSGEALDFFLDYLNKKKRLVYDAKLLEKLLQKADWTLEEITDILNDFREFFNRTIANEYSYGNYIDDRGGLIDEPKPITKDDKEEMIVQLLGFSISTWDSFPSGDAAEVVANFLESHGVLNDDDPDPLADLKFIVILKILYLMEKNRKIENKK